MTVLAHVDRHFLDSNGWIMLAHLLTPALCHRITIPISHLSAARLLWRICMGLPWAQARPIKPA
jgi:hypothetical protein